MLDTPFDLSDRVAIVTGGGTGIGAAAARVLARHGAHTVLTSRTRENLERVAAEIERTSGRRSLAVPADLRDEAQVVAMVEQTAKTFGRIDILINNAGGTRMQPLEQVSTRAWDGAFNLNVRTPYLCVREAGRHMAEQRQGAIVNISSGAGLTGVKGGAPYSAAKAGLQMFTRVIAAEWGRLGIRANCLAVGAIASENPLAAWRAAGLDLDELGRGSALGRVGTPEEVAWPILFLASEASAYINGVTIEVNGGSSLGGIELET
jgi:3-oxoacyl-[acyl-carrier protein] reductase